MYENVRFTPKQTPEFQECARVAYGGDTANQVWAEVNGYAQLLELPLELPVSGRCHYDVGFVLIGRESLEQRDRIVLRAAHDREQVNLTEFGACAAALQGTHNHGSIDVLPVATD